MHKLRHCNEQHANARTIVINPPRVLAKVNTGRIRDAESNTRRDL
jgi:hypothetical protein